MMTELSLFLLKQATCPFKKSEPQRTLTLSLKYDFTFNQTFFRYLILKYTAMLLKKMNHKGHSL